MLRGSAAAPPVAGMARAGSGRPRGKVWSGMLVWRVRFWLLALAVGLVAANADTGAAAQLLAARTAAAQAGCAGSMGATIRRFASVGPAGWLRTNAPGELHCTPAAL